MIVRKFRSFQKGKFYVCGDPKFWSTKHSREERMRSLCKNKKFSSMMTTMDNNAVPEARVGEVLDSLEGAAIHFTEEGGEASKDDSAEEPV